MISYNDLTLPELFDLLEKKTRELSELFADRKFRSDEYLECRNTIREIQEAIQRKQQNPGKPDKDSHSLNSDSKQEY